MSAQIVHRLAALREGLLAIDPSDRLYVHKQNPANYHNWTRAVGGEISANELLVAVVLALAALDAAAAVLADGGGS